MSKLFTRLLKCRQLDDDFLNPRYENLSDPFLLPDMKKGVARLKRALENSEKILIYGDYDADGVTASTLMEETLINAGLKPENIDIMLPDRFTDGYGMSPRLIQRAKDQGISLVITVDCGSRNHEIIEELNTLHIDTIVTDHHEVGETLPEAVAVINPKRKDFEAVNGLDHLAGVGVAFKFAQALKNQGLISEAQEKWLLDLVIIGTVCDSMLLTGENRILGAFGLIVLAKTRRPGLKELMHRAGIKNLNTESIGFQIGPRLNAAGRLKSATLSLNLLRATSGPEAAALAEELEQLNKNRKTEQLSALRDIKDRGPRPGSVIIEVGPWHEGILGIIAGRLVEEYQKPAFALAETEPGIIKGSGRSFGDFNLAEALNFAHSSILGGGGHAAAAGVRLEQKNLYRFREQINEYYDSLELKDQQKYLKDTPDLSVSDFSELTLDFLAELKTLEPFGAGNEEPIFRLENVQISAVTPMGADKTHLRLDLIDSQGRPLKLVAFFAPEKWLQLTPDTPISPLVKLTENDFNGIKSVEARICDIIFL